MVKNKLVNPTDGVFKNNPIFIGLIAVTSAVVVTKTVIGAAIFSAVFLCVLVLSSAVAYPMTRVAGEGIYRAVYMIVAAGLMSAAEILISYLFPSLRGDNMIYAMLIVVSATLVSSAYRCDGYLRSVAASVFSGIGYGMALIVISFVRELLSTGMLFSFGERDGVTVFSVWFSPLDVFATAAGGLILVGLIVSIVRYFHNSANERAQRRADELEIIKRGEHEDFVYDEELDVVVFRRTVLKLEAAAEAEAVEELTQEAVDLTMLDDEFEFTLDEASFDDEDDGEIEFEDYDYE